VLRDQWQEQRTAIDLPPNIRIPHFPAAQFGLVEPHFHPGRAERFRDATRGGGIFAGIAQEYGTSGAGGGHGVKRRR
jgi:hypothetical protein